MNLLFVTWNFPPAVGGIESMIGNLFYGLRARGHRVTAITSGNRKAAPEPDVIRATRPGVPAYLIHALLAGFRQCRRSRPDFILCGSLLSAPVAWLLALVFRKPWGLPLYGSDLTAGGAAYRLAIRFFISRADRLFPISRFTQSLAEKAGMDPARATIIHPGVTVEPFAREPATGAEDLIARCENRRVIITVGRLIRRKGVLEFVRDVMPGLIRDLPEALLIVVGDDGAQSLIHNKEGMRKQIEEVITQKNLGEHVILAGKLPDRDLHRLYFHAHVFVMPVLEIPGDIEGFGIVFSEAALAGVPSVATRTGGITDAIEDGHSGLLVSCGDTVALQTAVHKMLVDEELRTRMGRQAAERTRTKFAWPVIVGQYEQAIRACCRMGPTD